MRVRQAGTSNLGTITKILYGINEVKWEKLKPYFIEVTFDDETVLLTNPSQLTKKKL